MPFKFYTYTQSFVGYDSAIETKFWTLMKNVGAGTGIPHRERTYLGTTQRQVKLNENRRCPIGLTGYIQLQLADCVEKTVGPGPHQMQMGLFHTRDSNTM